MSVEDQKAKQRQAAREAQADAVEATDLPEASQDPADEQGGDRHSEAEAEALAPDVTAAFEAELVAARRKADENWDRLLRAEAELSNARKAAERARKEALTRLRRELLIRFLEIADNLDRASAFQEADRETLLEGIAGIRREVSRLFEREGVARVEVEDADFDPNLHDAIAVVPTPNLDREKVIQVERPGYTLDGELLRPARVIVGQPIEDR